MSITPKPDKPWAVLLRQARVQLKETQTEFGERWDRTATAISLWENGQRDVPNEVTWWLLEHHKIEPPRVSVCGQCKGTGLIYD